MVQVKPPQAEAISLMTKADKNKKKPTTTKDDTEEYFKPPKLCLALKLEISKHPLIDRAHV